MASELDIFNEVTSLTELNIGGYTNMPKQTAIEFSDSDLIMQSTDFWKFKEQKQVVGLFERWETDSYGQHAVLMVDDSELHLPNLTALNGKLKNAKTGNAVKIEYLGQAKGKKSGRLYEDFRVYIKQ